MKHDKAMELVAALRSGKYIQGTSQLKIPRRAPELDKYCCLGVACLVAGETFAGSQCLNHMTTMPPKVMEYFGFKDEAGALDPITMKVEIVVGGQKYAALTLANDHGRTFEEIADAIESQWERF